MEMTDRVDQVCDVVRRMEKSLECGMRWRILMTIRELIPGVQIIEKDGVKVGRVCNAY